MPDPRSWVEIDLGAITANAAAIARRAAPASLCAVVKSNAYGHGLVPVAKALEASGLAGLRLAVFTAGEAMTLRDASIGLPILVVGPVAPTELADAVRRSVEVAMLDESAYEQFAGHRVATHVKIDTGTSRFGISQKHAPAALRKCRDLGVNVVGIYSHLASSEDLDKAFTFRQVDALLEAARGQSAPPYPQAKLHIAASAAAMMWPQTRLDMVRCGIALYGAWPSPDVRAMMAGDAPSFELRPTLRWFAPIVQLRDVRAGESVGYGRAFLAQRDSRIATLPLGYADGLPRAAGMSRLRVHFAVGGSAGRINSSAPTAPLVGRICMNACMLDVTELRPQPAPGDVVEIHVEDVARAAHTINYEVLAGLPVHLERRYQ